MKVKLWDKKEQINGVNAEEILKDNYFFRNEDVILILNNQDVIRQIETPSALREMLNLDKSVDSLEVGEAYLKHIAEQNKQSQDDRIKSLENTILELKEVI